MFVLDTDHLVILQDQVEPESRHLLRRMTEHPLTEFFVSIVSFQEQVVGWNAYLNRARTGKAIVLAYDMFQDILADFAAMQVLPFDDAAAEMFDQFRHQRVRIGTMDLRIASVAIAQNCTVLTRNLVDFQRVPGLRVEDWTRP